MHAYSTTNTLFVKPYPFSHLIVLDKKDRCVTIFAHFIIIPRGIIMSRTNVKWLVTVFFSMTMLAWPYIADAARDEHSHQRDEQSEHHQGGDFDHGHARPQQDHSHSGHMGAPSDHSNHGHIMPEHNHSNHGHIMPEHNHSNHGHNHHYHHNGKDYNYYHNGDYYNYFYNGEYFLYFINGAYYNFFYNGAYYRYCKNVPGYWSHGHWNPSTMICH